jgi:septum site-determining protein MinC
VAHPADSNTDFRGHFVYRGNLRSGQVLHRKESIIIIGDVNPGANVISDGDILIWGRFRGVAHAGAAGDEEAVIAAMVFAPIQLRIGHLIAIAPDNPSREQQRAAAQDASKPARIAYAFNDRIVVANWADARRDNRWVLRRAVF